MKKLLTIFILFAFVACANTQKVSKNEQSEKTKESNLVLASDLVWGHLNPKRGDKAPAAADLWGDRTKNVATGFLVKFKDGFASPPHIHNISYRGIVISGSAHNDDPKAAEMWMPQGSYWTQPQGEVHITAAKGDTNIAYIEIDEGPYLVMPLEKAFDNGERPINVDASNMVWLDAFPNQVKVAHLWVKEKLDHLNGTLVKLPVGFEGKIKTNSPEFKVVVIKGDLTYKEKNLSPGSFFSSEGQYEHEVASKKGEVILYIRTKGKYDVVSSL